MKIRKYKFLTLLIVAYLVACGTENREDAQFRTGQEDALADDSYYLDNSQYNSSSSDSTMGEKSIGVIATLQSLHKKEKALVAECLGILEAVNAFEAKKEELEALGVEGQKLRQALTAEHESLRALIKGDREAFKDCRKQARDSAVGTLIEDTIQSCWLQPEGVAPNAKQGKRRKGVGRFGVRGRGETKPQFGERALKGRKQRHKGLRLPPRALSAFDTEICQAAVADAGSYLKD